MYEELVTRLRKRAKELPEKFSENEENIRLFLAAADAIESTSKAYQMMAEAYEAEVTKPKWIPVTERLPKIGDPVLCYCRANIYEVMSMQANGGWMGDGVMYMSGFVTHWMPLPKPPEEE